jgi:hypothetical protein
MKDSPKTLDCMPTLDAAQGVTRVVNIVLQISSAPHVEPQSAQPVARGDYCAHAQARCYEEGCREEGCTADYRTTDQRLDSRVIVRLLLALQLVDLNDTGRAEELAVAVAGLVSALVLRLSLRDPHTALEAEVDAALWAAVRTGIETPPAGRALLGVSTPSHLTHGFPPPPNRN